MGYCKIPHQTITEELNRDYKQGLSTFNTLTSVSIFSILFSIHFLRWWQGEFVFFSFSHFLYSCEFMFDSAMKLYKVRGIRASVSLRSEGSTVFGSNTNCFRVTSGKRQTKEKTFNISKNCIFTCLSLHFVRFPTPKLVNWKIQRQLAS